jgi:hypothetical protein
MTLMMEKILNERIGVEDTKKQYYSESIESKNDIVFEEC